jgi:hypothetical protein
MKKLITIALALTANIVFCQQNKATETTERIVAFSKVEKTFTTPVNLRLIVESNSSCIIKSNETVTIDRDMNVENAFFHIGPNDESTKLQAIDNLFAISPNPSSNTISISSTKSQITKITVISIEGKRVFETKPSPTASYGLDVSSFSNGVYILNIETNDGEAVTQKFIKE